MTDTTQLGLLHHPKQQTSVNFIFVAHLQIRHDNRIRVVLLDNTVLCQDIEQENMDDIPASVALIGIRCSIEYRLLVRAVCGPEFDSLHSTGGTEAHRVSSKFSIRFICYEKFRVMVR